VRRQELDRPLAGRAFHILPKRDRLARIISRPRHVHQPDLVRFRLLRARIGQRDADQCGGGRQLHDGLALRCRPQHLQAALLDHLLANPLGGVTGADVSDLMAEHSCELVVVPRYFKQPDVDADLAAGQRKGIRRRVVDHRELPPGVGDTAHLGDPRSDRLDPPLQLPVLRDTFLPDHLPVRLRARLVHLVLGNEDELLPSGYRRLRAGC
jgi:hypothetical protein